MEAANYSNIGSPYINNTTSSFKEDGIHLSTSFTYTLSSLNCFFLILGIFGNILILIIMMRSSNRFKSYYLLIIALAMSDMLALITNTVNQLALLEVFNVDVRALTDIGCIIFMCVYRTAMFSSPSIIVLKCMERFVAVVFPFKSKRILSRKVSIASLCISVFLSLIVGFLPSILYSKVKDGVCQLNANIYHTIPHIILRVVIYSFVAVIPMMMLLTLTPVIILKLYRQRAVQTRLTTQQLSTRLFRRSVMLISIVTAYMILVGIPSTVYIVFILNSSLAVAENEAYFNTVTVCIFTGIQINNNRNFMVT